MFDAISKAAAQLKDRTIQRCMLQSLIVAMIVFIIVWSTVGFALTNTNLFAIGWLETIIDLLGGLATLVITWMLFPGVISAVMAFFLETVAGAVEQKHYPHLGPAQGLSLGENVYSAVKFLVTLVALNLFLLLFLLIPPLFPFVFYAANGYLLGREYFELVSLRRMNPAEARALRKKHKGKVLAFGVLLALLLSIPIINLLTPIIATAAMVHLFETWRGDNSKTA
jgi:CysZ protein